MLVPPHWQWTPNQYLASFIGAELALIATHIVVAWQDRSASGQKMRPPTRKQRRPQVRFGRKYDASYEASPRSAPRGARLLIQIKGT
jgi:hypothetical protein